MGNGAMLAEVMRALSETQDRRMDRDAQRRQNNLDRYKATLGSVNQGIESGARVVGSYLDSAEARKRANEDMAFKVGQALRQKQEHEDNLALQRERMGQDQMDSQARAEREAYDRERQFENDAIHNAATRASTAATLAETQRQADEAKREADEAKREEGTRADISKVLDLRRQANEPPSVPDEGGNLISPNITPSQLADRQEGFASQEAETTAKNPDVFAFLNKQDLAERGMVDREKPSEPKTPAESSVLAAYIKLKGPRPKMDKTLAENIADTPPGEPLDPEDAAGQEAYNTELAAWEQGAEDFVAKGGMRGTPPDPAALAKAKANFIADHVRAGMSPQQAEAEWNKQTAGQ